MPNTNCLEGMRCPKCGSEEPFSIVCRCAAEVFDDGTGDTWDYEWDEGAHCRCIDCGFSGTVKSFRIENEPIKEEQP